MNPAYPLNYMAPGQTFASLHRATITEAPSLATGLAYPLNYVAPRQTLPSFYNATNTEAPSFATGPAYPLNYTSTPSLYNAVNGEDPILSNEAFRNCFRTSGTENDFRDN